VRREKREGTGGEVKRDRRDGEKRKRRGDIERREDGVVKKVRREE
jgi:hypothetical protein